MLNSNVIKCIIRCRVQKSETVSANVAVCLIEYTLSVKFEAYYFQLKYNLNI